MFVVILRSWYKNKMSAHLFSPFSDDEFMEIWRTSATLREAADRLGTEPGRAAYRARMLRAAGREIPMKRRGISDELFRVVWMTSGSPAEVAKRLRLAESGVSVRAVNMRKKGWNLPKFSTGNRGNPTGRRGRPPTITDDASSRRVRFRQALSQRDATEHTQSCRVVTQALGER